MQFILKPISGLSALKLFFFQWLYECFFLVHVLIFIALILIISNTRSTLCLLSFWQIISICEFFSIFSWRTCKIQLMFLLISKWRRSSVCSNCLIWCSAVSLSSCSNLYSWHDLRLLYARILFMLYQACCHWRI